MSSTLGKLIATGSLFAMISCDGTETDTSTTPDSPPVEDSDPSVDSAIPPATVMIPVQVFLDGSPIPDTTVLQPGRPRRWTTNANGEATVIVDMMIEGGYAYVSASHPEARAIGKRVDGTETETVILELERYAPMDNPDYIFRHPGSPTDRNATDKCAHCHVTLNADWVESPHSSTASNPIVHDIYAGVAASLSTAAVCADAGGQWWTGLEPGTAASIERCYLGYGTLPDLNEHCGDTESCDDQATETGACADCHAPGIDGQLGGRDLLEASGIAFDYGVHCDVCHRVDQVDLAATAPGVAGKLQLTRPIEPATMQGFGDWRSLYFGPYDDVTTFIMGAVKRDHFRNGELCAGCHQYDQPLLVPDGTIDNTRWPNERIPVHTTFEEWQQGPMSVGAICNSCHMPPHPDAGNSADLYNVFPLTPSEAAGWVRPPGEVRHHSWIGPRTPTSQLLQHAAELFTSSSLVDDQLTVSVTVKNVGAGHAIPTGEPSRSMVLLVEANCNSLPLEATGGQAVPDFGGYLQVKSSGENWDQWDSPAVGQRVQVIQRSGSYHDYIGHGPFGDGTFDTQEKGLPEELVVGSAEIVAVNGEEVTFDTELPDGDIAYLVDGVDLPTHGDIVRSFAGAPGFAFARVMTDGNGARMVPHHRATDIASDNRILPQQEYTTTHRFAAVCSAPEIHAVLIYRRHGFDLARERQWTHLEAVMAEVRQ